MERECAADQHDWKLNGDGTATCRVEECARTEDVDTLVQTGWTVPERAQEAPEQISREIGS